MKKFLFLLALVLCSISQSHAAEQYLIPRDTADRELQAAKEYIGQFTREEFLADERTKRKNLADKESSAVVVPADETTQQWFIKVAQAPNTKRNVAKKLAEDLARQEGITDEEEIAKKARDIAQQQQAMGISFFNAADQNVERVCMARRINALGLTKVHAPQKYLVPFKGTNVATDPLDDEHYAVIAAAAPPSGDISLAQERVPELPADHCDILQATCLHDWAALNQLTEAIVKLHFVDAHAGNVHYRKTSGFHIFDTEDVLRQDEHDLNGVWFERYKRWRLHNRKSLIGLENMREAGGWSPKMDSLKKSLTDLRVHTDPVVITAYATIAVCYTALIALRLRSAFNLGTVHKMVKRATQSILNNEDLEAYQAVKIALQEVAPLEKRRVIHNALMVIAEKARTKCSKEALDKVIAQEQHTISSVWLNDRSFREKMKRTVKRFFNKVRGKGFRTEWDQLPTV